MSAPAPALVLGQGPNLPNNDAHEDDDGLTTTVWAALRTYLAFLCIIGPLKVVVNEYSLIRYHMYLLHLHVINHMITHVDEGDWIQEINQTYGNKLVQALTQGIDGKDQLPAIRLAFPSYRQEVLQGKLLHSSSTVHVCLEFEVKSLVVVLNLFYNSRENAQKSMLFVKYGKILNKEALKALQGSMRSSKPALDKACRELLRIKDFRDREFVLEKLAACKNQHLGENTVLNKELVDAEAKMLRDYKNVSEADYMVAVIQKYPHLPLAQFHAEVALLPDDTFVAKLPRSRSRLISTPTDWTSTPAGERSRSRRNGTRPWGRSRSSRPRRGGGTAGARGEVVVGPGPVRREEGGRQVPVRANRALRSKTRMRRR
jgi:hypothetical protein